MSSRLPSAEEVARELGLRFGVSPQRNWVTLWRPAIDALGGILGEGDRPWHPCDDRISLLVLERQLRHELEWDVQVEAWWAERAAHRNARQRRCFKDRRMCSIS